MMEQVKKILQFLSWPVTSGILIAVVLMQYQQMRQLDDFRSMLESNRAPALQALSFADAINRAAPSVVSINATNYNVEGIEQTEQELNVYLGERDSLGSGVIVSADGYIVTNFHVVESLPNLPNVFDTVVTLRDGRSIPATLVAYDETIDLAVLHINMDDLTPIPTGNDNNLKVGDVVFAIGYPRNIGQAASQGIVSALGAGRGDGSGNRLIQTDAAINPGNSGGALIDRNGNLVGINASIISESGRFEGIGFATPVSTAIRVMEELVAEAIANNPGYLGVVTGEVLNEVTSMFFLGVPDIRGMLVENIDAGGPAERAGIQPGDVITRVDDRPVVDEETIIMEFQNKRPGDRVQVQVYRNGRYYTLPVVLGFGQAMVISP